LQVFMGGKHLPTPAWLVFFAAVDELSGSDSGRPEVWAFLRDQCLACVKSTHDFSDIGDRVPLLEAMVCKGWAAGVGTAVSFPTTRCHWCRVLLLLLLLQALSIGVGDRLQILPCTMHAA
jgi:hypothetical protein